MFNKLKEKWNNSRLGMVPFEAVSIGIAICLGCAILGTILNCVC